jgi:lipid-A-disaccharide synthase
MAVILPFEERLWRDAGYDAVYVGHPAMDRSASHSLPSRAREQADLRIAILPGSRVGEVARLADPFLRAGAALLEAGSVRSASLVLAAGLGGAARESVERLARQAGVPVVEADAARGAGLLLGGFEVSICASGTASLEAALAGAAPVVAYRMDPLAFALARRLVRTPHIALPNVLLGRRAFPELLQGEVTPARLAAEVRGLLGRRAETPALAEELREVLAPPSSLPFGRRVAELMLPWLG